MPKKEKLIAKLCGTPIPKNFTVKELHTLMGQCECEVKPGGRGSGIRFVHVKDGRILVFDEPHPGNELYPWQVKAVKAFLKEIGELGDEKNGDEV